MISKRALSIDNSGIRKMFGLAATLKNPVDLSIGVPDFDVLPEIREAAASCLEKGTGRYTVTQGNAQLCEQLRTKYAVNGSAEFDVMLTSGVAGGFTIAYMALLDPGDEVLIPDPFFVIYRDLATLIGAQATYYDTYPNFELPLDQIESSITPRTKAIVLNSPGNPTGYSYRQDELDAVIDIAKRKGIWVIYDEIYEGFSFDKPHAQVSFSRYDKIIILNGYSKSHGMPGWRVGFAVAPKVVLNEMMKIQQYTFVCANSLAQAALAAAGPIDSSEIAAEYREKRDYMFDALSKNFKLSKPGGAFYLFPEAPGGRGTDFVMKCLEKELLVVPGAAFSRRDTHFRISFAAPMQTLERGAAILNQLAG